MSSEARDIGLLQGALNDAAGKASVLWTTFISYQLYLAIALGSVTHRNLFLEDPIRLPLLNVELPLVGFFAVATAFSLIFHAYLLIQILALTDKVDDYEQLLKEQAPLASDRRYIRHRLDPFVILQFLAGPSEQRRGLRALCLKFLAWITLVAIPVVILVQGLTTFLPYHNERIVWFQRLAIFADLLFTWFFWHQVSAGARRLNSRLKTLTRIGGFLARTALLLFVTCVATFPGELAYLYIPSVRFFPRVWPPAWSNQDDWASLHSILFGSGVGEVRGKSVTVFANRLILVDQSFVDAEQIDKKETSRSLRGRDLTLAAFDRSDLRKADFTGAKLDGASFAQAKLQSAHFGCADTIEHTGCTSLENANFTDASLERATFSGANMRKSVAENAKLQGAFLDRASLDDAWFRYAHFQGADFELATARGANLVEAQFQGASLRYASFAGAQLYRAQLQAADLQKLTATAADFGEAQLQGANLSEADFSGASLVAASLAGTRVDFSIAQRCVEHRCGMLRALH